jgi:cell division protein FtsW
MIAMKMIPCQYLKKIVYLLMLINLILMILVLIPGIGNRAGGASRWLSISGFSFQPSEFLKFTLSIYLAYSMSKKEAYMATFWKGLLPHLISIGIFIMLLKKQPDLGTATLIGLWMFILLFISGTKLRHIFLVATLAVFSLFYFDMLEEYQLRRLVAFLHPTKDPNGINFQIIHSLFAFGSGGIFGTGIGSSKQAHLFLPAAHTDFPLSILAEEMGLIGVTSVIILFGIFIWRGIQISLNATDLYKTYLAMGITIMIGLQAIINMCVVMSLLPNKGLPLPFISYGGSSIIFTLMNVGVLLNISKERIIKAE